MPFNPLGRRPAMFGAYLTACLLVILASTLPLHSVFAQQNVQDKPDLKMKVKVLIITMFYLERDNWLNDGSTWVPILPAPPGSFVVNHDPYDKSSAGVMFCRKVDGVFDGVCLTQTSADKTNATASVVADLRDPRFSFRGTYFLTNGTAAVPPYRRSTLGSVALAHWVVDWDQGDHLLPVTAPGVPHGYIPPELHADETAVFQLNQVLERAAYTAASQVRLEDSDSAKLARQKYPGQSQMTPSLLQDCDTVAGDNLWAGLQLSQEAQSVVNALTGGKGDYCTYEQEDSGVATALKRFDYLSCYLNMRAGSAFDQPYPGQTVTQFLNAHYRANNIALANLHAVGLAVINYLLSLSGGCSSET